MESSFLSNKSVNRVVESLSFLWLLTFFFAILVHYIGIIPAQWEFVLLLLVAVHYLVVRKEFFKARTSNSSPGFSATTTAGYLYAFLTKKTSRTTLWLEVVFGLCLLFAKEGMHYVGMGTKKFVILHSPTAVESVLSSNTILRKGFAYKLLRPLLGEGLITSDGKKWQKRRKLVTPSFHFKKLEEFIPVFDYKAKILVHKLEELTCNKESIDIIPPVSQCTLDVILETAMGKNMRATQSQRNEYIDAFRKITKLAITRLSSPFIWNDFIFHRTQLAKVAQRLLNIIENFTVQVISARKLDRSENLKNTKAPDTASSDKDIGRKTKHQLALLDLLLDIHFKDNTITLQDIVEEVNTFIAAGHHTTASGINWTLYLLGLHEDIQIQAQKEIDSVLGEDADKSITPEEIKDFKYLRCVLKESLRLYPPIPILSRTLDEDTEIGGYKFSKGTTCSNIIYVVHRNPKFYPNPEEFNPDRFSPENSKNRHPYAYIPFSAGPRNCIGQRFAMNEMITILARVLHNFSIKSIDQRDKVKLAFDVVLIPDGELRLKFTKRQFGEGYSV